MLYTYKSMIGIDEVGRGAWAGSLLVVAAQVIDGKELPRGLTDSKLLSKSSREKLYPKLIKVCEFGEGWVSPEEVDDLGLTGALRLASRRAVEQLGADKGSEIIIDGNINFLPDYPNARTKIKADLSVPIVSAASVYAKVLRDNKMFELAKKYPEYDFAKNVGYGTKSHIQSLKIHGVSPIHRKSYKPVAKLLRSIA